MERLDIIKPPASQSSLALRASQEIIAIQSVGYHRYLKLRKFVPVPIRIFIRNVYRRLKFK